ncbi:DNA-directed RNA polymerase III subunit C25 [Rhizoctonia solani AG-1 IB]|uniref:DNA-directed RNA polymerase III subunit C25 n=1 Tax=Thanatephorus cucumeris (strain AG1-IB / isolate 7/3/14) TaxID=1108050 RepID=A0A0B7FW77_THACB|nr:DNA-directed RNA polymerase III subunit C25 [Rhizoctonia solani AG-1 IB]
MFVTTTLKDNVSVAPSQFSAPAHIAITNELNKKYANRVLLDIGLCICVFDLIWVGEGVVKYGDGCYWYKVTFRMVVFRPARSEVIIGKVKSSTEDGIRVTLGFFDDIYIPRDYLPIPSAFDHNEQAFFWLPPNHWTSDEPPSTTQLLDTDITTRLYLDRNEVIRLRVERDEFYENEPGPRKPETGQPGQEDRVEDDADKKAPYTITASVHGDGLGALAWWENTEQDNMEE